jgi:hypothetical protein
MAFLNGIFGNKPAAPAPAAPQQTAATQGGSAGPAMQQQAPANPGANPANMTGQPGQPPAGGPQASALDSFADMFKPKPADPAAPKAPGLADPYLTPIDPAAFKQQVNSANFAASIPAETMQKAMAGDAAAFAEAINHATREAFSAATTLSHGLSEHAARQAAERVSGSLDGRIRNTLIRGQNTTNEVLSKPAVAPIFNAVKAQIAQNNPQLSPEMVQQSAEQYFMEMSNEMTAPQRQAETAKNAPKAPDFSYLLGN